MAPDARRTAKPREPETSGKPAGTEMPNWADFIDSLHQFRAPTARLERAARGPDGGAGEPQPAQRPVNEAGRKL